MCYRNCCATLDDIIHLIHAFLVSHWYNQQGGNSSSPPHREHFAGEDLLFFSFSLPRLSKLESNKVSSTNEQLFELLSRNPENKEKWAIERNILTA